MYNLRSAQLIALVTLMVAALLAACGGSGGGSAVPAGPQNYQEHALRKGVAESTTAPSVPPMGVYNSCEIDTALTTMCEQEDLAMTQTGFSWEINYIGLLANATGSESLQAWFTYDESIGMSQVIDVGNAVFDPVNVLTGDYLITDYDNSLANTCPAMNNEQIISCIYSIASSVPGFNWKWYVYDEPDCPNQSIGYCVGNWAKDAPADYTNLQTLVNYINSIDPNHQIIGTNVGDWSGSGKSGEQAVINELYSWLAVSPIGASGFDNYPIPQGTGTPPAFGETDRIGTIAGDIANTIAVNYPSQNEYYVGQAFSWYQENGNGCTSIALCPYPTKTQMTNMRNQALYYANAAGNPLSMVFWYYWPDISCLNTYTGCSASANEASVKAAVAAPFPATAPPSP
jgi:hypothetical protein